jgi:hypothetical protein
MASEESLQHHGEDKIIPWLQTVGSLPLFGSTLKERASGITLDALGRCFMRFTYSERNKEFEEAQNILRKEGHDANELEEGTHNSWLYKSHVDTALHKIIMAACRELKEDKFLMSTRKGYIGWAYPQVRSGDHICILSGCSVPCDLAQQTGGRILSCWGCLCGGYDERRGCEEFARSRLD